MAMVRGLAVTEHAINATREGGAEATREGGTDETHARHLAYASQACTSPPTYVDDFGEPLRGTPAGDNGIRELVCQALVLLKAVQPGQLRCARL